MALDQYVGHFTSNTSTGDQTISGVGFTPKLVLFWWEAGTSVNATKADCEFGFGCAISSTERWACAGFNEDAVSTQLAQRYMTNTACISMFTAATNPDGLGDFKEFNSDGFVITWDTAPGSAYIVHYMCLGGTDIGSLAVGTHALGTGSGTTDSVTGLGFQPDVLHMGSTTLGAFADPVDGSTFCSSYGWATGTARTDQYAFGTRASNGVAANPRMGWFDGVCLRADHVDPTPKWEGLWYLSSFDSDGYTLTSVDATRAIDYFYLAFQFTGNAKAGVDTQATSATTKSNTDPGFEPAAGLFFGANTTTNKATSESTGHDETRNAATIGASDGTNESAIWFGNDAGATIAADSRNVNTKAIIHGDTNGTYSTDAEADLSSFDAGGYTLDWTTADASARYFGYMLFGESWAGPYVSATGSIKSAISGTTVTPVIPTHAADDIIFVEALKNGASNLTCSGYTAVVTADNDSNLSSAWFWKRATSGSETDPVVTSSTTASASDSLVARVLVITGCVTTGDPFEDATGNADPPTSTTTPTGSSVTNTETLDLAMTSALIDDNQTWATAPPPVGWVLEADDLADPGAPVIESVAEWSTGGSTGATVDATEPDGVEVGDLLLIVGACEDANINRWGTLTGWTQLTKHSNNSQDVQVSSYWRIADGTESWPYTVTHSDNDYAAGWTFRISGADGTTPIETQGSWVGGGGTGSSLGITGFTPGADNCLILAYAGTDGSDAIQTESWSGTGWPTSSEYKNEDPADNGNGVGIVAVTKTQTTAAATNTATVSLDVTDGRIGQQIAIQPATGLGDGRITTLSKNLATATTTSAATVGTLDVAEYWRTLTLAWTSTAAAAGTTYEKAGTATAGMVASGTDVAERAETGSAIAGAVASGADAFEANETGTATSGAVTSGADVFEASETGSAIAELVASGTSEKTTTYEKAGTVALGCVASGADVSEFVESGSADLDGLVASGSDVGEFIETGSAIVGAVVSGSKAADKPRAGSGVLGAVALGSDAVTYARTGSVAIGAVARGGDASEITRAGAPAVGCVVSGSDASEHSRANTASATAALSGSDVFEASETGTSVLGLVVSGTSAETGTTYSKTGSASAGLVASAQDAATIERAGTADLDGLVGGGADVTEAAETGTVVLGASVSGTSAIERARTGSATSGLDVNGSDVAEFSETGSGVLDASARGADISEFAESGTGIVGAAASGSSSSAGTTEKTGRASAGLFVSGDQEQEQQAQGTATVGASSSASRACERTRAGAAAAGCTVSGTAVVERARAGTATLEMAPSGADAREAIESGSGVVGAVASGTSSSGGTFEKTGRAVARASASAARVREVDRSGSALLGCVVSGSRSMEYGQSGSAVVGTSLTSVRAREFLREGQATLGTTVYGLGHVERLRSGTAVLGAVVSEGGDRLTVQWDDPDPSMDTRGVPTLSTWDAPDPEMRT